MQAAPVAAPESLEQIFERVYLEITAGEAPPSLQCTVRPYVNTMGKIRLRGGSLEVRVSQLIDGADCTVKEALAWILLSKLFRRRPPGHWLRHYRQYMNRREVRRFFHITRQARGRKFVSGPQGEHFDLEAIFERLNQRYFHGLMARPLLGWSRGRSRTLLGHFDPSHNAIIVSRILDSAEVPALAVEYVLYHEMLHLRHPAEHRGSRRRVHTREFRQDERAFEGLKEAKDLLKRL